MNFKEALRLIIYTCCLAAFPLCMSATETTISGEAPHLSGKVIRIFSYTDPISCEIVVHDTDTVSPSGSFTLKINADATAAYTLAVNRFTAPVFMAPGAQYTLTIVAGERDVLIDTWQKGALTYVFTNLDSTDVNTGISRFEQDYYQFFLEHETIMGTRAIRPAIRSFEVAQLEAVKEKGSFLETYVKYAIGSMKLALGAKKSTLYENYVKGHEVALQNPSWYNFVDQFYGQYFDAYDSEFGGEAIYNRLNKGIGLDGLDSLLTQDTLLVDQDFKMLVLLKSISESLYNAKYPSDRLLHIAESISETGEKPWSLVAGRIADQYRARTFAIEADQVKLRFKNGRTAPWLDEDTLMTYVFATATWSTEGAKEIDLLESLASKYPEIVKIAVVYIDDRPEASIGDWPVSSPEDPFLYMQALEAYAIPHCFWVEPGGRIGRESTCLKPSEGLEKVLFKKKTERDKKLQIKVGQ